MTLARGRVLPEGRAVSAEPMTLPRGGDPRGKRLEQDVLAAQARARTILEAAAAQALEIVDAAARSAEAASERAREVGRAEGFAEAAALAARLAERDHRAAEAGLERTIELSCLLAERLIGHALGVSPGEIARLARSALEDARGARRVKIHAHPADAEVLRTVSAELDPEGRVHTVVPDAALGPGDLRLETDVGVLDARLGPSLGRLAARLREVLRR